MENDYEALDVDYGEGTEPPASPSFLAFFFLFLLVCLLTVLSQVGGLLLCASQPLLRGVHRKLRPSIGGPLATTTAAMLFGFLMATFSFFLIPALAPALGRVPLPCSSAESETLRPATKWTCFFNRHYVLPDVRSRLLAVAKAQKSVRYLDASFPFGTLTPLLPHLGHRDGREVDLAFVWADQPEPPSPIGYGVYDGPAPGEPVPCAAPDRPHRLRWDFAWLQQSYPGSRIDIVRTRDLIDAVLASRKTRKLFVEPHLAARMALSDPRVAFQGCDAARHDDHFHVAF